MLLLREGEGEEEKVSLLKPRGQAENGPNNNINY
jgi:hypothetical protein